MQPDLPKEGILERPLLLEKQVVNLSSSSQLEISSPVHHIRKENVQAENKTPPKLIIDEKDYIYFRDLEKWDAAPVVIEEFQLLFFTVPKVACTTFKQLFRRIMGEEDWASQDAKTFQPHNPAVNGLKYLWDYPIEEANRMMTDPTWTRAIFLRDPKERLLSAFLDKVMGSSYKDFFKSKCCRGANDRETCYNEAQTLPGFLGKIKTCSDSHWDPQYYRMEPKYWDYVNYIGHVETLNVDGVRLLQKIGAWEMYGESGWGEDGMSSIFGSDFSHKQSHVTHAKWRIWQWYTPTIERQVEAFYVMDYANPAFNFTITNLTKDFFVSGADAEFSNRDWDAAPIVIEKYHLIFFTIPVIGATEWKQAFRRMENLDDWKEVGGPKMLPHDPTQNGLKYLYHYNVEGASEMMLSKKWTRAIFVRNPKDRFLSVFQEIRKNPQQIQNHCCPLDPGCEKKAELMPQFLMLTKTCHSAHWEPLSHRVQGKFWAHMDFIGTMENVEEDSKNLLQMVGAWEDVGVSGWGPNGTDRIFATDAQEMNAIREKSAHGYSRAVDELVKSLYKVDFENQLFNFT